MEIIMDVIVQQILKGGRGLEVGNLYGCYPRPVGKNWLKRGGGRMKFKMSVTTICIKGVGGGGFEVINDTIVDQILIGGEDGRR